MEIKLEDVHNIKPYGRNPRRNQAIDKVAESIKDYGFRQPIVVDKQNVIIAGHTRFEAAKKLGLKKVPIHVAKDLSKEKVVAYRIADNRVAMDAQWDFPILKQEIGDLLDMNFDIDLLGFDDKELARLIEGVDADLKDLSDSVDTVYEVVVECANEGEQEKVFKKIEELGFKCRILTL